jgi:hypothetical protein
MRSIRLLVTSFVTVFMYVALLTAPVYAAGAPCTLSAGSGAPRVIPTWYKYVPGETVDGECVVASDLGGKLPILVMMGVFDILLFIGGVAAVVMVMFGGYKFLVSTGEPQKIAGARTTIFNALIGLAITIVASQIVGFVAGRLA